jgi:hypothetical protein
MPEENRPDPDAPLARVQADEAKARRGKLKIFFGASAGVGKTFAMLAAARAAAALGRAVVIGVVETHGRSETEAMARDLARLPLKEVPYRGRGLKEFDLDAALAWGASTPKACCCSTSWRTATCPATETTPAATPSAGRTSRSCSPPAWTCGPPSTCSIWRA